MTFKSEFSYIEVQFTDENGKYFEIEYKVNLNSTMNYYKEK